MSDFAAGDYMAQKLTEFTNTQADAYWATPHPAPRSGPDVLRTIVVALARLI